MAYVEKHSVTITTDASGDAVGYIGPVMGHVLAIHYVKDDYVNGVDFTIESEDLGETIWQESDVNAARVVYPRVQVHDTAGAGRTYDGTREVAEPILLSNERVKITVAQGGNAKSGTFYVLVGG